jgi:hypothetical protein
MGASDGEGLCDLWADCLDTLLLGLPGVSAPDFYVAVYTYDDDITVDTSIFTQE